MKISSFISPKNNDFVGQFKSLNNNEMINLRGGGGGGEPPLPPGSGEDLPIDLLNLSVQKVPLVVLKVKVSTAGATSLS